MYGTIVCRPNNAFYVWYNSLQAVEDNKQRTGLLYNIVLHYNEQRLHSQATSEARYFR